MPRQRDNDRDLLMSILDAGEGTLNLPAKVALARRYRERGERSGPLEDHLVGRLAQLGEGLAEARQAHEELRAMLAELLQPPWYPAIVDRILPASGSSPRLLVHNGGSTSVVGAAGDLDLDSLAPGDEIYLGKERNIVVARAPDRIPSGGETGVFDRWAGRDRLVIKSRDEEIMVKAAAILLDSGDLRPGDHVRFDRGSWFAFEKVERSRGGSLFLEDTPGDTFASIGGLDAQIAKLQRAFVLSLHHAATAARYGLKPPRSALLVGPPGVGKTITARALCNWLSAQTAAGSSRFMNIKPGALHSVWYSATEANYREAFRIARAAGEAEPDMPVVIFIDEIDSVGRSRGYAHSHVDDRVLAAFLAELDGLEERGNVFVLGATNRREACDPALLRDERLGDNIIEMPRPNMEAARSIFGKYLKEDLPYADSGGTQADARGTVIDTVVSQLYAPNGDNELATLVFRDGNRRAVKAADIMSGAMIAGIVRRAVERACAHDVERGERGITALDLAAEAAEHCAVAARALTPLNCREYLSGLPDDEDVVSVVLATRRISYPQAYLRAV